MVQTGLRSYLDTLAEDINEKLQQAGHITFGEITKQYDLPPDFLEDVSVTYPYLSPLALCEQCGLTCMPANIMAALKQFTIYFCAVFTGH